MTAAAPSIVLGVTSDASIILMRGFPEFLRDRGWEVHVVSASGPNLDRLSSATGVRVHRVEMRRQPAPIADLRALVAWVALLHRLRPDVVSVGTPKAGLLGSFAGAIARVPTRIYVLRGLRLETATGAGRRMLMALERLTAASAHAVVAVSRSLREEYLALHVCRASKVVTIGEGSSNGVDLDAHRLDSIHPDLMLEADERISAEDSVPIIGFVGRLTTDKGLAVLAAARDELIRRGVRHRLVIVGGTDDDASAHVFADSADVVVTGHVDDPRPYYHRMTVLCLPTYREGFPNVVLEAAASGIPAVTTDATGAVDSVIHGETGLIVPVGSSSALADALEQLLTEPELARTMGERARARARADFDRRSVWTAWASFYEAHARARTS